MNWFPVYIQAAASRSLLSTVMTFLQTVLPFIGVVLGFAVTRYLQIEADKRARLHRETSARSIIYAQLQRIRTTTSQQLKFIAGPDKMIWLTLHRSLLPAGENLSRLEPLSAPETNGVTAFYYLYKEQISFLTASAMEVWEPDLRQKMGAMFNLETDVIAFDYSLPARRDALVYRLTNIKKSADKALTEIRAVIEKRKAEFPSLYGLLESDAAKLGSYQRSAWNENA